MRSLFTRVVDAGIKFSDASGHWLMQSGAGSVPGGKFLVDLILWPSDFILSFRDYRNNFNRNPRLWGPGTYNDMLFRRRLFERKSHHIIYADKLAVRDVVKSKVGKEILSNVLWTGEDLREVDPGSLPERFVVKANHSWNTVLLVEDQSTMDWDEAHERAQEWLADNHSRRALEWHYRWIPPRLYIEEWLGEDGVVPVDYKFFCFHGRVEFVQVHLDRYGQHSRAMLDRDFKPLPFSYRGERHEGKLERPVCFEEMVAAAESLSAGEPFIRVDLYDVGRPVFGELTLIPTAGRGTFDPPEYDEQIGRLFQATR